MGSGALRVGRRCKHTGMRAVARNRSQRGSRHLWAETGSCQSCPNGLTEVQRARLTSVKVPSGPAPAHPHTGCSWQRGEQETAVKHSSTASQTFPTMARTRHWSVLMVTDGEAVRARMPYQPVRTTRSSEMRSWQSRSTAWSKQERAGCKAGARVRRRTSHRGLR